jgi:hypothetical protein
MSRDLPPRPNLEHLRKQAKALLSELQQHNPALQLADAQHALAREYGFASWPKLTAHVNAVSRVRAATSPFAGTWAANPARSQRHPLNPFRSATLHIDVVGDVVTVVDVVVDADGREEQHINTIRADGSEHPSENGNGYTLTARWRGPRVLETFGKKDGQVIGRGVYEVAADGTTLTISSDEQMIVLDRDVLAGTAAASV